MAAHVLTRHSRSSPSSPAPFPNRDQTTNEFELQAWANSLSPASTSSLLSSWSPRPSTSFTPTVHLQIQTQGKPCFSLPLPVRPDPIPIFDIDPDSSTLSPVPRYISVRSERSSGSSQLVSGDNQDKVVSITTYRFGPGKPPVISLLRSNHPNSSQASSSDTFPMTSASLLSRSQFFRHPHLGTFSWRYASRSGRRVLDPKANSILILERVMNIAVVGGKTEEVCQMVGMFVRSEETRTPGSKAGSAGNGGRLMLDLRLWERDGEDGRDEREMVVVLAVTSVVVMLKKEVDRRRAMQIGIMVAVAGGGGGP